MSQKFYIAGKYTAKDRLAEERERLQQEGFTVTSSWMDEVYTSDADARVTDEVRLENAKRDYDEVLECGNFIIDTIDESATGGREVELGLALYSGEKMTYRIGPYRNVFHTMVHRSFEDWDEFYDFLLG